MYTIRSAGAKGLGVFASSSIPRGTRIFSEPPLLGIRQDQTTSHLLAASQLLPLQDRRTIMGLSHYASKETNLIRWNQALKYTLTQTIFAILGRISSPDGGGARFPGWRIGEHVRLLSIFRSNSFNLGPESVVQQALFPSIARINHSCVPNAQGNFHGKLGTFNVHATRDISVDEELTINYLHEYGAVKDSRQRKLTDGYGFDCDCPACNLESKSGRQGEEGRLEMQKVLCEYADDVAKRGEGSPEKELGMIRQFITLLESDGIAGRELSTLYFEAARLSEELEKREDALISAQKGLEIDQDCLGTDHELYQKSSELVQKWR